MASRRTAGFVSAFYNPLQVPNAPTSVSATGGDAEATVSFTAPTNTGGGSITGYGAVAIGTSISSTNTSSPITLTGLTNGTTYTIGVWALNSYGPSPFGTSGSVTPAAARGVFGGGVLSTNFEAQVLDYVIIATTGNAVSFGDLTVARSNLPGCGSSTRGLFAGGSGNTGPVNVIDYITIASASNATDFGDLSTVRSAVGACSNSTRGVFAGGSSTNVIDYVTIASAGNATDFGDLTAQKGYLAGCSTQIRGLFGGGRTASVSPLTTIEYVTIASTGNATNFGDLTVARRILGACSNGHGGLQ